MDIGFSISYARFTSAQEAPTAQGQTVAGASGTQVTPQTSQTQGSLLLMLNQLMRLKRRFFNRENVGFL